MLVTIFHPFLCPFFDHPRKLSPLIKYAKKCGTGIVLPANQFTNRYNKKAYQTLLVDFFYDINIMFFLNSCPSKQKSTLP